MSSSEITNATWVGWADSPSGRGTYDVLLSCFLTLLLASWTALHMNIDYGKSRLSKVARRVGLVLFCVMFPDMLFLRALQQLDTAWWLRNEINRTLKEKHTKSSTLNVEERSSQDITCPLPETILSSEGGSGDGNAGSEIQTSPTNREGLVATHTMVPSKNSGIHSKIEPEHTKGTSDATKRNNETPEDRSRSPSASSQGAAELWTLKHAFWVTANGFAVRLNESDNGTVVLTSCGVIKLAELGILPKTSIEEIESRSKADEISKILVTAQALWFLVQLVGRAASHLPILLVEIHSAANAIYALLMYLCWLPKCYQPDTAIFLEDTELIEVVAFFALQDSQGTQNVNHLSKTAKRFGWILSLAFGIPSIQYRDAKELPQRGDLAVKAEQRFASTKPGTQTLQINLVAASGAHRWGVPPEGKHYIASPPAPVEDVHDSATKPFYLVVWLLCIPVYGAIHLAAWNTQFASVPEQWLWRSAALLLAGSINLIGGGLSVVLTVHATILYLSDRLKRLNSQGSARRRLEDLLVHYRRIAVVTWVSSMILARVVILFEIFFSLRRSPVGAYDSMDWSNFFPHLGG